MGLEDLPSSFSKESIGHDDHPVARSQERVREGLEAGVARACDRQHMRIAGRPEISQHLPGLAVGFDPRIAVEASRAWRVLRAREGGAGRAPGLTEAPVPWNRSTMGGTLLQTVPTRFVTERKGTVSRGFRPRRR